ncbi:amino acid ABC transporter substrate-binding protein [Azorhizobium oxalatiphilum]|uniref:Amino acid ABC transporter substrate-binding protein n=1 Tax=Azorhizobium oxalatiphilum TaxID=980631 RepID=A0A917C624_9HYPH|nr:ABC transporter substrate-binding protein [Azorhizobium oxalatiphilum]GGF69755.1 amino acid ABC transporter substrate-binding protein [Azorhizobium oxalatiphilum]
MTVISANRRRALAVLLGATVLATGIGAGGARAADEVVVGVVQPLSGPNAQFGIGSLRGTELAADMINAAGGIKSLGGAKIKLVVADVPTPNTAAATTQRLISQNGVSAVVGAFVSSTTLAASEVTERAGIPLVTFAFADQITGRGYKYAFQVSPKGTVFGAAQFDYAMAIAKAAGEKIDKVAILYEDTAYGTAQAQGLRDAAKKAGVQVVMDEAYPLGITDVAPLVNKLKASGAQMAFPVSYLNDGLLIIRSLRQQQIDMPVIGGAAGYIIPDFKKGLGDYAEGVISVAAAGGDLIPDLAAKYKEKYGTFITHEALIHAAALDAVAKAMEKAKSSDPEKVRDALATLDDCTGLAQGVPGGCVKFDATGLNTSAFPIMVQWRGDELVTVYPEKAAKSKPMWHGKPIP